MDKNKCSSCGEKKCSCGNKDFTKAVIEIDSPEKITLMRKVTIPASMGDDTTVPPAVGKYYNVLLYYEANQKSYLYSSDGIPTLLVNGVTDYEQAVNLPQINGNTLIGDKTGDDLGLQDKLTAGDNITIENDVISATDTTYGPATDTELGLVKPGDGLEVDANGTMSISDIEQYAHFFDTVADMEAATNLVAGDYARTIGHNTRTDNGGCLYYIRSKTQDDDPNGSTIIEIGETLVAELAYTNDYLPINYNHVRYQGGADRRTDVWYAIIPSDFKPDLYLANNTLNTIEEPSLNAKNNMTTLTINAGVGTGTDYAEPVGVVIKDGVTIKDNSGNTDAHAVLLMDNNGVLKTLPGSSTTSEIEALEPKWAVCGWWPIIADGNDYSGDHDPADYKPRTFIGQDANGNYIVGVCAGRQYTNPGLSAVDMKNFVTSVGFTPVFLYSLDGGGSSVMIDKGKRVNKLDNFENRSCATFIGFKSNHASNKSIFEQAYTENIVNVEEYIDNFQPKEQKGFLTLSQDAIDAGFSLSSSSTISIVGDLVNVNMEFTTTGELARYAQIYSNFPPATTTYLQIPVFDVEQGVVNYIYIQNGELRVNGSSALVAGKYRCNLTYKLKYNG